jgi:hypothetical protein
MLSKKIIKLNPVFLYLVRNVYVKKIEKNNAIQVALEACRKKQAKIKGLINKAVNFSFLLFEKITKDNRNGRA